LVPIDLSSALYGGNKVRTLEHSIACAASEWRKREPDSAKKGLIFFFFPLHYFDLSLFEISR
jgi:hypothetical protein